MRSLQVFGQSGSHIAASYQGLAGRDAGATHGCRPKSCYNAHPMSAVLYIRVSTSKQAQQAYNLPTQQTKLKDHCGRNGWDVLKEFVDTDSARTDDRPQFQAMLEFCRNRKHKVTYVVVADLSRLARNVVDQGTTIAELTRLGIKLVSVDEPNIDDTAAGRLSANLLGAMNQFFSDSLSERIRYRMKAGFDAGRFLHYAPIGYLNVDKNLVRDPERAALVQKAFELFASGAYSTGDAVLKLVTGLAGCGKMNQRSKIRPFCSKNCTVTR